MGTSHSSSRSSGSSGQQYRPHASSSAGSHNSKYASYNPGSTTLDRNPYSSSSSSPHLSNHGSSPVVHQKSLSRRRSSNRTTESNSSLGTSSHQHNSKHMSSHREEGEEAYVYRFGRRFHNTSSLYMLPNDSQEVDRLHEQHYIFKAALEKNIHVPVPENGRVIDFGCGPATWAMDMATEMSTVNFVGVDISPVYPTAIYPRNCNFYNENILDGISQPDDAFDVVYQRNVTSGFTFENWQKAMKEAYRVLKPGGYYECVEVDVTIHNGGPSTEMVFNQLKTAMAAKNVDLTIVRSLDRLMTAAGFTDVHVKEYVVPVGEWGGMIGSLWKQNVFAVMETIRPLLAAAARMSDAQVQEIVNAMVHESSVYKAHQILYVTYGRKPL